MRKIRCIGSRYLLSTTIEVVLCRLKFAIKSTPTKSAELSRLQNQVVAQARELALLRYEISALLTRDRIGGTLQADTKRFIKFHFPNFARGAERIGVALDNLILSWRPKTPKRALAALGDDLLWSTLRGPLLLVGDEVFRKKVANYLDGRAMVLVSAGSGPTRSLPVPQSDEPPLRSAAPGSLVTWSIENPGQLRRMNTIVVDAADELSLGLLRGRLSQRTDTRPFFRGARTPGSRFAGNGTGRSQHRHTSNQCIFRAARRLARSTR